ncbi:hypothetical protein IJ00_08655 [Calothrix sp. 336/3]|nr:hypothetical protein IJ00_08655 [Calothrix sp. 336/3]
MLIYLQTQKYAETLRLKHFYLLPSAPCLLPSSSRFTPNLPPKNVQTCPNMSNVESIFTTKNPPPMAEMGFWEKQ